MVSSGDVAAVVKQEVRKGFKRSLAPLLTKARAASSRGGVQVCLSQPPVDSRAGTWESSSGISRPCLRGGGWTSGWQDSPALGGCSQERGAGRIEMETRKDKSSVILPPGQVTRKRDLPDPSYGGGG